MADTKTEIAVYRGTDRAELTARGEPVTARNAPAIVRAAGAAPSSPGTSSSRASLPTPTPARPTARRPALPRLGRGARPRLAPDHPRRRRRVPSGLDVGVPTKKLRLAALQAVLRSARQPACVRHQPGGDGQGRALRRGRGQDAADRRRSRPARSSNQSTSRTWWVSGTAPSWRCSSTRRPVSAPSPSSP